MMLYKGFTDESAVCVVACGFLKNYILQIYTLAGDQKGECQALEVIRGMRILLLTDTNPCFIKYLIYTSTENRVPLLVPLECKYGPFVLPQGACQIS